MGKNFLYLIFLLPSAMHLHAQKKVNRTYFINLLNAGEYDKVFDSAVKLRNEVYGKNAVVDYFIAKSLCLDGHTNKSTYCFNCIIKNFKLSGSKKDFIEEEIKSCTSTTAAPVPAAPDYSYINNVTLPESSVGGKMGRVYDCFSTNQVINLNNMVKEDELEARLFGITKKKEAVAKITALAGNSYRVDTGGRYVFVSLKTSPLDSVKMAVENLEKAYRFFVKYYNLRPPDKLLTVYILPNKETLRQTANLVHGIALPDPNIGYSNLSDLSLLGIGDAQHLGTMYHELFHLMVRTDIGDIPPFLDEGLASLYAVSTWKTDTLKGDYRPWRLDELKEASRASDGFLKIPALDKIINYSWAEFDGQETKNVCQVAVNYALSNFLMIYLQEKGLLQQMVVAFKNRPFVLDDTGSAKGNVQIFETIMKDSIKKISLQFERWFYDKYDFNLFKESYLPSGKDADIIKQMDDNWALLAEINDRIFKYNQPADYKNLYDELKAVEDDYKKQLPPNDTISNSVAPPMVQQTSPVSNAVTKREAIQRRLDAFAKKLRKIMFDNSPKTAN